MSVQCSCPGWGYGTGRQTGRQGVIDTDVSGLSRTVVSHRDGKGDRVAFIGCSIINDLSDDQIRTVADRDRLTQIIRGGVVIHLIQGDIGHRVGDGAACGTGIDVGLDG